MARFSLGIETEGPASAKCDVPQVAHTRAFVSFLDIGIGPADVRPRRVLDAIYEIALMDRTFDALLFDVALVSGLDAFFHVPALSVEDQGAMFTVHCGPITCPPRPDTVFPGNRANGELVGDRHGIGSFLVIVVKELAAGSNDAGRDVQIEDPAESVEGVNAVVTQFAGAVVPHPVPAVMETIGVESPFGCGAEPEIIVDPRGHLSILLLADIGPRTADPGPRMGNFAKLARANQFSGPGQAGTAAALRPQLDHAVVLAGGFDHAPSLDEIMGSRLFHVHVLAGLAGPNRG